MKLFFQNLFNKLFPKKEWVETSRTFLYKDFDEEEFYGNPWFEVWQVCQECVSTGEKRKIRIEKDLTCL